MRHKEIDSFSAGVLSRINGDHVFLNLKMERKYRWQDVQVAANGKGAGPVLG